ncbi:hypothetical protein [Caldicellulosiruptor acetigenus]|uniref:hypothetical protein n=1 Tax=Caldicellulosiruptor acetigenus TaxID=301953 RepID=UPI00040613E1|nr:hypothetical protein [Caldicellulosiruptor acetigenus]WAM35836.1 hypothetical protein OTK01_002200 [Caldicellulosiruptor acetigenus]
MKMVYRLFKISMLITCLMISSFILFGCEKDISNNSANPAQQNVATSKNTPKKTPPIEQQKVDLDELKKAIKTVINDDIWYKGKYSTFRGFENKKIKIEVYTEDVFPNVVSVFFDKKVKESAFVEGTESFFFISFGRDKKGHYYSEPTGYFSRPTAAEMRSEIKKFGYHFYAADEIEFGKVVQPDFGPMTEYKRDIIKTIRGLLTYELEFWKLKKGKYKAYIRNFRENADITYVLYEDEKGNMWIIDVPINEDGIIGPGKMRRLEPEHDSDKYFANQFKKVSFVVNVELK